MELYSTIIPRKCDQMRPNLGNATKCDQKLEQTIISVFSNIISIFIQR